MVRLYSITIVECGESPSVAVLRESGEHFPRFVLPHGERVFSVANFAVRAMQFKRQITSSTVGAKQRRVSGRAIGWGWFLREFSIRAAARLKWLRNNKCKFLEKAETKCFSYFS